MRTTIVSAERFQGFQMISCDVLFGSVSCPCFPLLFFFFLFCRWDGAEGSTIGGHPGAVPASTKRRAGR